MNKTQVNLIKKVLRKFKKIVNHTPNDDAAKIEEDKKIIDITERILYFNQLNQAGKG